MIFSGLELLGEVPFEDVIIHSTVLARDGRRMSKSLGTGIDPLDVIVEQGADAVRYGLLKMSSTQDVRFSDNAVEEGRKLANKLWNVSRLLLQAAGDEVELRPSALEERWILGRFVETLTATEQAFAAFDFASAVAALYHFTYDDFCDWYAEAIKPRLYEGDRDTQATALAALEQLLKLLHPVMPHVTEEIWSNLPARETRLIVATWPAPLEGLDPADTAFEPIRTAAEIFRRAQVRVELDDEQRRIFEAVVKPERVRANGNAEAEIERLRKEIQRAESMLGNERFTANAPPEVVEGEREKLARYRRELEALER
jgi:valyl-tRNA synthetase